MAAHWPIPYAAAIVPSPVSHSSLLLLFFVARGPGPRLGSAETWHLHMNCATLLHREPGWPVPLSSVPIMRLSSKKNTHSSIGEVSLGILTAAFPTFMPSWTGQGGIWFNCWNPGTFAWQTWRLFCWAGKYRNLYLTKKGEQCLVWACPQL